MKQTKRLFAALSFGRIQARRSSTARARMGDCCVAGCICTRMGHWRCHCFLRVYRGSVFYYPSRGIVIESNSRCSPQTCDFKLYRGSGRHDLVLKFDLALGRQVYFQPLPSGALCLAVCQFTAEARVELTPCPVLPCLCTSEYQQQQQPVTGLLTLTSSSLPSQQPHIPAGNGSTPAPFERLRHPNKGGPGLPLAALAFLRPRFASGLTFTCQSLPPFRRLLVLLAG